METILLVSLYVLLLISTCFIGLLLWRKKAEGDRAYMSFVSLIALLTIMILIDTNKLSKFRLTLAGKDYRLSKVEVEEAFKANISTILKVYHEYLVVESFEFSHPSTNWKIDKFDGQPSIFLKLRFEPFEKTVSILASNGQPFMRKGNSIKDGYYIVPILGADLSAEFLRQNYAGKNIVWEVRYIRKP